MKETLKTACCYNCKFLDEKDYIKQISPPSYKCSLQKSYKLQVFSLWLSQRKGSRNSAKNECCKKREDPVQD